MEHLTSLSPNVKKMEIWKKRPLHRSPRDLLSCRECFWSTASAVVVDGGLDDGAPPVPDRLARPGQGPQVAACVDDRVDGALLVPAWLARPGQEPQVSACVVGHVDGVPPVPARLC